MQQIILMVMVWVGAILPSYAHELETLQDRINVVGVGEIDQEPDQAILNIGINALEPTLVEAKNVADKNYRAVLEQIKAAGITEKFIKATRINAQPIYEWTSNKQVYKGEQVSRTLSVTINDLDKVSELMQALVESGVSTIDGLETGFQDPKAMQQQALGLAAADAKTKAEFLANQLGRNLGAAYFISEQNTTPQIDHKNIQMMSRSDAFTSEAAPPEMFGTQKLQVTINVSFNLL